MEEEMEALRDSKKQKTEMADMKISGRKQELEMSYGVHIDEDALTSAVQLLEACRNKLSLLEDMDAMQLVEGACQRLRESLDSDSEERNLDWDDYFLDRARVEVMELRKEKSVACRSVFLPRVERDLMEFKGKWERFKSKWAPQVAQMRHESEKRVDLLRHLRQQMVSFMERTKLEGNAEAKQHAQLLPGFSTISIQLQQTIPSAFKERLFIRSLVIAQVKVASSMTGLPLKYFQSPFNLRLMLEDLKSKLSEKLIGLDYVIHKITCALSRQKSSAGPFGSFLLLGPHGCGRTKLAKVLAEEIFDDKSRFIKLDMCQYKEPNYVSCLVAALDRDKKHGSIVMFDNIENAPSCSVEVLSQILRDGRLTDGKGVCVNFSHDVLLVSSHIGHEVFAYCRCLRNTIPELPLQEVLREPALLHLGMNLHPRTDYGACYLRAFYLKVANHFKLEFMDLFDDVVVYPWLRPLDHLAISRLQMRDVATSMSTSLKKQVILYPSDAALNNMTCCRDLFDRGAHAYESWHQEHIGRMFNDDILKNEADDKIIIYIDALLGFTQEYSFRVETSRHLERHLDVKSLKGNLWKLRNGYRREKLQVNKIYRLQISYFHLFKLIHTKAEIDAARVLMKSVEVVRLIDDILLIDIIESNLVHVDNFIENLNCCPRDRTTRRAQTCLKHVSDILQSSLVLQDKATQVIIEALFRRVNTSLSCHPPSSFLCLGLTSKEQFVKSLAQYLFLDDGEKLLIQVDLSLCKEPESFFRSAQDADTHVLLTEFVKRSPNSVVVFYKLEMAHISVFSNILSILEYGASEDNDGNMIYFGESVVVIISDLGDKEMIGGFNGHRSKIILPTDPVEMESTSSGVVGPSSTHEMGFRGLRFELLNQLDHMLLFDPCSGDQLNVFAKLSMRSLEEKSCSSLYLAFFNLFYVQARKRSKNGCYTTNSLLRSMKEAGGKDVIVRYRSRGFEDS